MFPSIITEKTRNDPIYARIMENSWSRWKTKVAPITIKEKTFVDHYPPRNNLPTSGF